MVEENKNNKIEKKKEKPEKIVETTRPESEKKRIDIEKKEKKKAKKKEPEKPKKTEAVVYGRDIPISTKYAVAVCKVIKGKKIDEAVNLLEQVIRKKQAVPMKGEIPHRRGKGASSGRYPLKASKHFIKLLKALAANATMNGMEIENSRISEAVANLAHRPYHRFGQMQFKRTHVFIKLKQGKEKQKKNKK